MGRGLRVGATVSLYNVHPIKKGKVQIFLKYFFYLFIIDIFHRHGIFMECKRIDLLTFDVYLPNSNLTRIEIICHVLVDKFTL